MIKPIMYLDFVGHVNEDAKKKEKKKNIDYDVSRLNISWYT